MLKGLTDGQPSKFGVLKTKITRYLIDKALIPKCRIHI